MKSLCVDCDRPMASQSAWRRMSFDRTGFVRQSTVERCAGCYTRHRRGGYRRVMQLACFTRREAS